MSKPRKLCIFCGGFPITKEHVWPDWLDPYLQKTMLNHETFAEMVLPNGTTREIRKRAGDPQSVRVRHVCQACNNGWMSVLQNEAKPILIPLLQGKDVTLFRKQQIILAKWVAMFCMVAEFMDKSGLRIAVSQDDRTFLKEKQQVPKNWKIWMALVDENAKPSVWTHNTLPIEDNGIVITHTAEGIALPNTQTTTFTLGRMLLSALSCPISELVRKQKIDPAIARQLWPLSSTPVNWPLQNAIDNRTATEISDAVINSAKRALARRPKKE